MSEDVKPATLEPADEDPELRELAARLIEEHHPDLDGATIRFFWALDRPLTSWGRTGIPSEETWWLSGGPEGGADVVVQLNKMLWDKLSEHARRGLLDLRLAKVARKTGGRTEMEAGGETRLLYEEVKGSLGLDPAVLARNPSFVAEEEGLRRLHCALATPGQYELQFPATKLEPNGEPEPEPTEENESERVEAGTFAYYRDFRFPAADGDVEDITLRFTEADHRPASLTGVFIHERSDVPFSRRPQIRRGELLYDTRHEVIKSFRQSLEEMLEAKRAGAQRSAAAEDDEPPPVTRERGEDEETLAAAGGSVTPIRGRKGGRG